MTIKTLVASKSFTTVARVKDAFQESDCEVIPAPTMSLALFLAQKNFPDAILADMELTDGDGMQLLREVKAEPELQAIPFVFFGDYEESGFDETIASSLGVAGVIGEEVNGKELFDRVMTMIGGYLAVKQKREEHTPE
jgi:DNA-binding response OmpR family regulator